MSKTLQDGLKSINYLIGNLKGAPGTVDEIDQEIMECTRRIEDLKTAKETHAQNADADETVAELRHRLQRERRRIKRYLSRTLANA